MNILRKHFARLMLLIGDVAVLSLSLYLALAIRYLSLPSASQLTTHFQAFGWLFLVWVCVFFIAGLYDRQNIVFPKSLPQRVFQTQIANILIAIVFFYTIPFFAITPKTNLFIYLIVSFGLIVLWRNLAVRVLASRMQTPFVLVSESQAGNKLADRVNNRGYYGLTCVGHFNPANFDGDALQDRLHSLVQNKSVSFIVLDTHDKTVQPALPKLYNLLYEDVQFFDFDAVYEEIFERVPLSLLEYRWFIKHVSSFPHAAYDFLKRGMDIAISLLVGVPSLLLYPFVALAIKIEDGGPIFVFQERIGENGRHINIAKFRSMSVDDGGKWVEENDDRITKVGAVLRKSRIDELPQLWSVLRGDLSLIGPRPDIVSLGEKLHDEIPFYAVRTLVRPGLSGWAQIKQSTPPQSVSETKKRLTYDIYYIKNRSFMLDVKIALRTIQILLSRTGK